MSTSASEELSVALSAVQPHMRSAAWFSIWTAVLALAPAAYMLEVYDRVLNSRNPLTLLMLTLLVLGVLALMELLDWGRLKLLREAGLALDGLLGDRVFGATFAAALRQSQSAGAQTLVDLRTLREFLATPAALAAMELPASLVFLLLVFAIHPLLGAVSLVAAALQALLGWRNERNTRATLRAANVAALGAQRQAEGLQRNAQVVAALGMLPAIERRWASRQREMLAHQAVASDRAGRFHAASRLLQVTLGSLLIGLGAWLMLRDQFPDGAGAAVAASIVGARMLAPLVQAITHWRAVLQARHAWSRLQQLLGEQPAQSQTMSLPAPSGQLQADQVVAAPPGHAAPVLKGVNFALAPGEVLAVAGPSGAGKSSLARVLVGLWPCASGKVRLDRADVFTWDKGELGPFLGYLPQDVELFDGTVAQNIARFGPVVPERVEAAARAAGVHETILEWPQAYDTPLGADGARLSGGQRQRVALARALYGDPVLVVLDEPNASLDEAGEAALTAAIVALKARGAAVVVITHRTGVLAVADRLLLLRDGQMQACGPRDEVLAALARGATAPARPAITSAGRPVSPGVAAVS